MSGKKWIALALATAAPGTSVAQSTTGPQKMAALFGTREGIEQISLSPDGTHVAMVMPLAGQASALFVTDVSATDPALKPVLSVTGNPDSLAGCQWATDTRIVCAIATVIRDRDLIGYSRLVTLNSDGSDVKLLSARESDRALSVAQDGGTVIDWTGAGGSGGVLMTRRFVAEETTGSITGSTRAGLGVERVDTATLRRNPVAPPRADAVEYLTDGRGVLRVMGTRSSNGSGNLKDTINYFYTDAGKRDWKPLSKVVQTPTGSTGFDPVAIDPALNVAYGFDAGDAGRSALYRVALDGTSKREQVVARTDVDVDSLLRIGRQRRVVGVSFVTERRESEFFDPELKKLVQSLGRALPGQPIVRFVDASADESKLLLFAGSDTDPGTYYLFDKATRKLTPVLPVRAQLSELKLAAVKPVRFPAADGTMIPGYLTLPPGSTGKGLPAIVMPHGGPAARDEWGFDWLAQFFAARGFAVLQPNFRGSAGYGSEWFQKNGFQSWQTAIGDVDDAGRWLVKDGIADPAKLAIVGWSYGGYAALQSAATEPGLYKAVVAIAPVTDLDALRKEAEGFTSQDLVSAFIGTGPHVASGSPARHAGRIKAPVLMFHGDRDQNVGVGESRLMAGRLKDAGRKVDYVEFKGLDHQIDDDAARTQMLAKADAFLRASMGM